MSKCCGCNDAEIGATIKFHCTACANVIQRISIKKPFKAAGMGAIIAFASSQFIEYAVTDNRYPLDVEYAVIEACTSSDKKPLPYAKYVSKKEQCLCAFQETMNEISYVRYLVNEKGFLQAFKNNAKSCR